MDKQLQAIEELRGMIDNAIQFAKKNKLYVFAAMLCTVNGASYNQLALKELSDLMREFTKAQIAKEPSAN